MQIKEQIYANNRTFPYINNLLPFHGMPIGHPTKKVRRKIIELYYNFFQA